MQRVESAHLMLGLAPWYSKRAKVGEDTLRLGILLRLCTCRSLLELQRQQQAFKPTC